MADHELNPYQLYDFEAANKRYIGSGQHTSDPLPASSSRVAIITCCDARCIPERFFQLGENVATVIRNAGGRTAEDSVIRTLLTVSILSEIKEIKVVHHTACGALIYSDEWLRKAVAENDPSAPGGPWRDNALTWAQAIASQPFSAFPGDTDQARVVRSVVQDVSYLREHPLIRPNIPITGWIYDLHTGKVEAVDCP